MRTSTDEIMLDKEPEKIEMKFIIPFDVILELDQYSQRWIDKCLSKDKRSFLGVILECRLFTHELINTNRLATATYVSLFPVRAMVHALMISGLYQSGQKIV
ncbi:hypothetical protein ASD24_20775 [Paenibacillus sp. Root52]|nr:hypothetical protein ASD24_20775 [Paenibacillus sp. Root52]